MSIKLFFGLGLITAVFVGSAVAVELSNEVFGIPSEGGGGSSESYLGVDTRDITPDRLASLQLKEERGVEVTMVDQDAPAGKAGLKEHDVILSVNGTEVESVEQLRRMIHEIPTGRQISIGISRAGQPLTVKAQLAARKKGFAMAWPPSNGIKVNMPPMPPMPPVPVMPDMDWPASIVVVHSSTRSGLMIENLTPQLGDFFGVKNGQGILVRSVEKGSRAEQAGFHAGDVIVRVNGQKISDSGDFTHALNFRKEKNAASVTILREKKELTLTLTLPEHGPSGEKLHESSNIPIGDARTKEEIVHIQSEIAQLQPEIQCEMARHADDLRNLRTDLQLRTADIQLIQPEIERATTAAIEKSKKEIKELQRRLNEEGIEIRKSIEKAFPQQADI
jgi:membrane-associated protease RseP (regulator of RpoE activity)